MVSDPDFTIRYSLTAVRLAKFVLICSAPVLMSTACRRDESVASQAVPPLEEEVRPADIVVFPDELRVSDDSVNAFVEKAMRLCAAGDYEAFRLLWSDRSDPLPRDEFEQGWRAVEAIRIRALDPVILQSDHGASRNDDPNERAFVVLAEVVFDPSQPAGRREPQREIVLILAREHDEWRFSRAPKEVREWIKDHVMQADDRIERPANESPRATKRG